MKYRLLMLAAILLPLSASACTLWGAAGEDAGNGTLISKNRDWKPDHHQRLKQVHPKNGFAYFGLYAEGNDDPGLKAGINEKGLTIISASSNIPKRLRRNQSDKHGVMIPILTRYASIDALLPDADALFGTSHANFFLISDRSKLLVVEIGLEGQHSIKVIDKGVAAHTNHYLDEDLAGKFDDKPGISSTTRLARIRALLDEAPRPLDMNQFAAMSRDHHDGPDNSLWRNGREFTLASWIVSTPSEGAPHLRVVIANPNEPESTQEFVLDATFWRQNAFH